MKAYIQSIELPLAEATSYEDAMQIYLRGEHIFVTGVMVAPGLSMSIDEARLTQNETEELLMLVQRIEERIAKQVLPQASYKVPA